MISSVNIVVDDTQAHPLNGGDTNQQGPAAGNSVLIKNYGPSDVYIGGADVTADGASSTGGYILAASEVIAIAAMAGEIAYAICATGEGVVLSVLRQGY